MNKSCFIKLLSLVLCTFMIILTFVACDVEEDTSVPETVAPTEEVTTAEGTEEETEEESETESETDTESDTESVSDTETESETEPGPCNGTHEAKYDSKNHWRDACEEHGVKAVTPKTHQFNSDTGTYQCQVCGYAPQCEGEHTKLVYLDATRHYVGPCEYCTFEGNPEEYAKHNFVGRDYICTDCGFDPTCNGLHGKDNGDGTHTSAACDICGSRASEGAVPHENGQCDDNICDVCGAKDVPIGPHICVENEYYVYKCTVCGVVPACYGIHEYEKTDNGHKGTTCEDCGWGQLAFEAHTIAEKTENVIDSTIYKYTCITCGYISASKEIPASVNKFIAPVLLASGEGYMISVASGTDESGLFYHAENGGATTGTGQHIWLREKYVYPSRPGSGEFSGGGSKLAANIEIGNARYIVLKVRASNLNEPVKITMSTTGWNWEDAVAADPNATGVGSVSSTIQFKLKETDTWTTFVADLEVLGARYAEDAEGGYIIDTFCLMQSSIFAESGDYIDIGYVAFVDDLDEARTVCDTSTFINIASDKTETVVDTESGVAFCDGDHEIKYDNNEHWRDACEVHSVTAIAKTAHDIVTVGGVRKCSVCAYVPEVCEHVNENNDDKCDKCGEEVTDPGVYKLTGQDLLDIGPSVTGKAEVDANGSLVGTMNSTGYYTLKWANSSNDNSEGVVDKQINVGDARFIVIKYMIKMKEGTTYTADEDYRIVISTTGKNSTNPSGSSNKLDSAEPHLWDGQSSINIGVPSGTEAGQWIYLIVDAENDLYNLNNLNNPDGRIWVRDTETGDYIIDSFRIEKRNPNAERNGDIIIDYIAFADDAAEIDELFANEADGTVVCPVETSCIKHTTAGWATNPTTVFATYETVVNGKIVHDDDTDGNCKNCGA